MKLGIKRKILLVLVGVLALTTALAALLASYFTNRQNEHTAFADLERDLATWQDDLQTETLRLRGVALDAVGDAVILNQLAELVTLEVNLNDPAGMRESSEAARTLAYAKSVSLNRLHLVLRTGGFTSIAVFTSGRLSHYVSATEAGMLLHRSSEAPMWVQASADAQGRLPFQSWPAWSEASPGFAISPPPAQLHRPRVSFSFRAPHATQIEVAVPVRGITEEVATDVVVSSRMRFVSELAISRPEDGSQDAASGQASTVAIVVFQKVIDRAALEHVARRTGKAPALFSPNGRHRQLLANVAAASPDLWGEQTVQAAIEFGGAQQTIATRQGSFYQVLRPWRFEGEPRLLLGLASSRASTLKNIQQTVAAILTAAGLMLLLSVALGVFWMNRFIDPIVALTAAAKRMGVARRPHSDDAMGDQTAVAVLHRLAVEAPDEVGDLAQAFDDTIAELRRSFETLEQRVQDRTAELRQQTRYLRTLIDTLPLLAWLKDTKSLYLAANQATADACGRRVEELVGKSDQELWPLEMAEAYRRDDVEVMTTRRRKTVEEPLAGVKGTTWLETYKAPVLDEDGTVLGTVGAARDISDRKAAEAAREAALTEAERLARLRSDFLAQMSHELRTPLNAILGYAQILQRDERLTQRQARGLATIQESGHHLLTLIDDILDLSRIGASKLELYPADIDLGAFLHTVADIIRVKADEKSLWFAYEGSGDLPSAVRVDDKRLRQVLLNLLGNAVKFTDRGHVTLRVQRVPRSALAESDKSDVVRVLFEVEDSGIGMTAEQLERIFDPFEQVAEAKRRHGGAGLGLAISRQLVRLMGGDIQVRSTPGKGSAFRFELDLPVAEGQLDLAPTQRVVIGYAGPAKKVLVVDDVAPSRVMLTDFLATLGFEVLDASNGEEAVQQAQRCRPDLVIMDITMPVMDGLEAARRMRQSAELAQTPIIITSASATSGDATLSLAAGASAFVPKPIEEEALLKAIGEHLSIEWSFEDISDVQPGERMAASEALVIPPPHEMDVLHKLALAGDMRDIRDRADYLEDADPCYEPFVRRLRRLAERYQSEAVLRLVERYRGERD